LPKLVVEVPQGLLFFLRDLAKFGGTKIDPSEWVRKEALESARATIDSLSDEEYLVATRLKEKYGLEEKEVN